MQIDEGHMLTIFYYLKYSIFRKRTWAYLIQAVYALLGGVFLTLVPIYCRFSGKDEKAYMTIFYLVATVIVALVFYFIDGIYWRGFLRASITLKNKAFDRTEIQIKFGDFFKYDGYHVVSVNEFFDSEVDDAHVAESSLHGQMIKKFWTSSQNWYEQVTKKTSCPKIETVPRALPARSDRYPIATTGIAQSNGKEFICVALSHTNLENLQAKAHLDDLVQSLDAALECARSVCANKPLNFPIIGGSLSRTGISRNMLLNILLMKIFEESTKEHITNTIRIILPYKDFSRYNLNTIKSEWS